MMTPKTFVVNNVRKVFLFAIVLCVLLRTTDGDVVTYIEDTEGRITSPYFPSTYPHNYFHVWKISVPQEYRIKLVFDTFDLEPCVNCDCDYLAVLGGYLGTSLLGRFCGEQIIMPVLSTRHVMFLKFKTDSGGTRRGFSVLYTKELASTDTNMTSSSSSDVDCNNQDRARKSSSEADSNYTNMTTSSSPSDVDSNNEDHARQSPSDLNSTKIDEIQRNLIQYLMNTRQKHLSPMNKWGLDIAKTAVALFLHDPQYFAAANETGEDIAYDLTLQLMSKLVLKKQISTKDLALFINAMTAACINPRNFFGVNVVAELRSRIENSNHTDPFFILALCNAGENMTMEYDQKLQPLLSDHLQSSLTEIQAMNIMAMKCIFKQSNTDQDSTIIEMVNELKRKLQRNDTIDNKKDTALIIQALIATESYETNFNLSMAINSIIMDMNEMHLTTELIYYLLPIFRRKSLLDINSNHCEDFVKTDLEVISEHSDERILVQISIIIGNDMDVTRTWRIKVPSNYSLYQALEILSFSEPDYKFQYRSYEGKMYVTGLANFQNSDDSFWYIYTKPLSSDDDPIFVKKSPVDIQVKETDELILWYKSRFTSKTQ